MNRLGIIVSSTRPGRVGPKVADWVATQAREHGWEAELIDLAEVGLPFLDEEDVPRNGNYERPHTHAWAATVASYDAIAVVTPQYNLSFPAPIKNAIDFLYAEWEGKPVALVGYGWTGATDATADLTRVLGNVQADVVGATGLVFPADLSPEGDVAAETAKAGELADLLAKLQEQRQAESVAS